MPSTHPTHEAPVRGPISDYDRVVSGFTGLPDVRATRPSTIVTALPFVQSVSTYIVQTFRDERGDTVALQLVDADGSARLILPPHVTEAIARQRDALTTKTRRIIGKRTAEARKARGEKPAFMKKKGGR